MLARAVRTRQRPLRHDAEFPFGAGVLRLRAQTTEDVVALARRRPGTHNARRRFVETQVLRALADEYRARLSRSGVATSEAASADEAPTPEEQQDLAQRLRRVPEVAEILDRMWPRLSPHEFLHDLLGARPLLSAAGKGILSGADVQRLHRHRSASLDAVPWTVADTALIDEARTLLGPRRAARPGRARGPRNEDALAQETGFWPQGLAASPAPVISPGTGADDEIRSFGHIVVDEVQDLSPMQLRMLARRSLSGSMTVVGDIAQATGPWAPAGWDDITRHLSPQRATAPGGAHRELPHPGRGGGAGGAGPRGRGTRHRAASTGPPVGLGAAPRRGHARAGLPSRLVELAREEAAAVAPGRVAVLGPGRHAPRADAGARRGGARPRSIHAIRRAKAWSAGLVVLPADETNGLEFDSVIVVEPSLVAAVGDDSGGEGPPGRHDTGLADALRGLHQAHQTADRPARRNRSRSTCTDQGVQRSHQGRDPLPAGWRFRHPVD